MTDHISRRVLAQAADLDAEADLLEREGTGNDVFREVESTRRKARCLRDQANQQPTTREEAS